MRNHELDYTEETKKEKQSPSLLQQRTSASREENQNRQNSQNL